MPSPNPNPDDQKMLIAQVSCVDASHISPPNRGKKCRVSLHNGHFLWTEDGDTVGYVAIHSGVDGQSKHLLYVPRSFVGQAFLARNLPLLGYMCPATGTLVSEGVKQLSARLPHGVIQSSVQALGRVAGFFSEQLIDSVIRTFSQSIQPGYHEIGTDLVYFDAPIRRSDLSVHSVEELRRAGLLPG